MSNAHQMAHDRLLAGSAGPGVAGGPAFIAAGRGGFSFVEILFAIFVLGIGLIMIAGVFPVAIQQSQATMEDAAGAVAVEQGRRCMETALNDSALDTGGRVTYIFDTSIFPAPGQPLFEPLRNSGLMTGDPRFAWFAFYSRSGRPGSRAPAYVFIIPVASRSDPAYNLGTLAATTPVRTVINLFPAGAVRPDAPACIGFLDSSTSGLSRAAEGALVLLRGPDMPPTSTGASPPVWGKIYRLGSQIAGTNTWEVAPGGEAIASRVNNVEAYIIGRSGSDGRAQEISAPAYGPFYVAIP